MFACFNTHWEEYDVISPTGVQTFDLWEKRGEVHGQLVVPSLHNNLENLKDNFNFHLSWCGKKNRKKKYCLQFLPSTVLWKRGKKGALLSCWTWYSCGEEFPKSMQQKIVFTLIVFIGKTSSSTHKKNEKNKQWIYSNKTLFLLLSFSLLRVLPEQKPLEIEVWQSRMQ